MQVALDTCVTLAATRWGAPWCACAVCACPAPSARAGHAVLLLLSLRAPHQRDQTPSIPSMWAGSGGTILGIISYKMGRNMMCVRCAYTPRTGGTPFYAVLSLLALSARHQRDDTPSIDRPCGRGQVAQSWASSATRWGATWCTCAARTRPAPAACRSAASLTSRAALTGRWAVSRHAERCCRAP